MILDDTDLARRFTARAATFPEPSGDLFARISQRIDTSARAPFARVRRRVRFNGQFAMTAALAATFIIAAGAGIERLAQPPALQEKVETVRIDRMPTAPPASNVIAAPAPVPKQIKINTLKTAARSADGNDHGTGVSEPAAPAPPDAIARAETLGLLVRDVPSSIAALTAIARTNGGIVTNVNDTLPDDPSIARTATLSLTVAAARLDVANAKILALGSLQSRTGTAEAIGDSIVDDRARLRNLRREETDLLHIMDRSGTVESILDVESKLADVRGQIEQITAQLATSNHRVATSQIDITLTEARPTIVPATPTFGDHITATWSAALRSIVALAVSIADLAVWCAAYAPLWIVLAIVVALIIYRRRSRF
jgi:hypothetical protein